jgi:diketogulonate reductase-like aldo/keto reductase
MRARGVQIESWGPSAEGRIDSFANPALAEIGAAHGKSDAEVVLRWLIQRDPVVIPKSVGRDRVAENSDVFVYTLRATRWDASRRWTRALRSSSITASRRSSADSVACGRADGGASRLRIWLVPEPERELRAAAS